MDTPDLGRLRSEIADVDRQIVELAARRSNLAGQIGEVKRSTGADLRDFSREKDVVSRARAVAAGAGLSEDLAEKLMLALIRSSLVVQEQGQVRASSAGTGRSALVVGGLGHMGRWFVRFLESQGFLVEIADPRLGGDGLTSWNGTDKEFDIYVVATPLPVAASILEEMAAEPPEGLIFDIGSLKTPLRKGLEELAASGARVASIHPMFGADTDLLSGRHVVLIDVGHRAAADETRELFESTMASIVEMDLDSHDRLIAYILGLSHALNIAFFTALAESGEAASTLAGLSSTTFDRQLAVASQVAAENPGLYFEIQHLNRYGNESLEALSAAVEHLRDLVESGDSEGFSALMNRGAAYLDETMRRL